MIPEHRRDPLASGQITAWAEPGETGEPGAESGPGHDPVHDP